MNLLARLYSPRASSGGGAFFAFWRTITYLTSLCAFMALFLTGELPAYVSIGFAVFWLVGFFFPWTLRGWRPWMSNTLTILLIVYLAAGARDQFFVSLLTLLLYLILAKSLTLRSPRDYLQAQILCFFILLATAVITVAFHFIFFFAAYLILGTLGLILYSLSRPEDRGYRKGASTIPEYTERLPRRLVLLGVRASGWLSALIIAFFILIPHVSVQRVDAPFSTRRAPPQILTGFSEEMEFGEFKSLRPDPRTVLHIEPSGYEGQVQHRPDILYLRGVPLEAYDEYAWRRSKRRGVADVQDYQKFIPSTYSIQRGRNIILRVHQDPHFTMRIFTVPVLHSVDLGQERRLQLDADTISLQIMTFGTTAENTYADTISYTVTSNMVGEVSGLLPGLIEAQKKNRPIYEAWLKKHGSGPDSVPGDLAELRKADPEPASESEIVIADAGSSDTLHPLPSIEDQRNQLEMYSLIGAPGEVPWLLQSKILRMEDDERAICLQLPPRPMTEKIRTLAREIAPGPSDAEIVQQLLDYFRTQFSYTLEPETPSGMHPIDAFLFETKRGHCEYFATAFVLMLRARGVPARIINGFYVSEWFEAGGVYIAKQSDAHAWAEVWLDGPGWLTADPTPPDMAGRAIYGLEKPTFLDNVAEYLRIQWQRYVIDYSSNRQLQLFKKMRDLPGLRWLSELRERMSLNLMQREMLQQASAEEQTKSERRRDIMLVVEAAAFIALVIIARALWHRGRARSRLARGYTGYDYLDPLFRRAEKAGRRRAPHQTPGEFLRSLSALGWPGDELQWLAALYYRHRFSGSAPDPSERRRAGDILHSLPKTQKPL